MPAATLRVNQWTKNAVVLAAFVFAMGDPNQDVPATALVKVLLATFLFCLASSCMYVINDLRDAEQDRSHPVKRMRPIASGEVTPGAAKALAVVLGVTALVGAALLARPFFYVIAAYIVIQLLYTFGLKRVALIDVFVIAAGFVLRALGGAVVLGVPISPWLLLCALLLALFLGFCKRRHEKVVQHDSAGKTRPMLKRYDEKLLDQLIAIVSASTVVCYALYTLWPDTVEKFGSQKLGFTIPFVIFGLFRYLDLVYRHEKGGRPERILLTDLPLMVNLALYGLSVLIVLFVL